MGGAGGGRFGASLNPPRARSCWPLHEIWIVRNSARCAHTIEIVRLWKGGRWTRPYQSQSYAVPSQFPDPSQVSLRVRTLASEHCTDHADGAGHRLPCVPSGEHT